MRTLYVIDIVVAPFHHGAEVGRASAGGGGGHVDVAGSGVGRVGASRRFAVILKFIRQFR